ncbi:hypothetical protein KB553_14560 [Chryseobacterium rhizoplanae]|nr:hypothetical protein [Chryseobacterium rhizoplanae]UCA58272.1 hypothetical protein KB553_14560 [Chryseobacterium rhizoplanae]
MESFQAGKSWCTENTALFAAGVAVGAAMAGSGVLTWAGAAVLYSCLL